MMTLELRAIERTGNRSLRNTMGMLAIPHPAHHPLITEVNLPTRLRLTLHTLSNLAILGVDYTTDAAISTVHILAVRGWLLAVSCYTPSLNMTDTVWGMTHHGEHFLNADLMLMAG